MGGLCQPYYSTGPRRGQGLAFDYGANRKLEQHFVCWLSLVACHTARLPLVGFVVKLGRDSQCRNSAVVIAFEIRGYLKPEQKCAFVNIPVRAATLATPPRNVPAA